MSAEGEGFLSRWSRLKRGSRDEPREADDGAPADRAAPNVPAAAAASPEAIEPKSAATERAVPGSPQRVEEAHPVAPDSPAAPVLAPIESLTPASDFKPFMQAGVDATTRNAALKRLFADPQFNVMDGLDVYIDDYTKPDPIDAETVRGLVQARYLFDPPKTRVNERGDVEEVPPEAVADAGGRAAADEAPALPEAAGPAPGEPAPPAAPVERTESVDPKARP